MSQYTEHEKLEKQSENFHLLMQFAEFLQEHPIVKDLEDGAPVKEEHFEEAVYSFLGLNMYQIKNERKQMEEQLKKQANES